MGLKFGGFPLEAYELNKMEAQSSCTTIEEASQINTVFKVIEDSCRAGYFTQVRSCCTCNSISQISLFLDQFSGTTMYTILIIQHMHTHTIQAGATIFVKKSN